MQEDDFILEQDFQSEYGYEYDFVSKYAHENVLDYQHFLSISGSKCPAGVVLVSNCGAVRGLHGHVRNDLLPR